MKTARQHNQDLVGELDFIRFCDEVTEHARSLPAKKRIGTMREIRKLLREAELWQDPEPGKGKNRKGARK